MIYPYKCFDCDNEFDVIKSVKQMDSIECCPQCHKAATRVFTSRVHHIGASVQDYEYNPAFGKMIKNKKERMELAKRYNMEEVGNEDVNKIHKKFDKEREEKIEKSWENV